MERKKTRNWWHNGRARMENIVRKIVGNRSPARPPIDIEDAKYRDVLERTKGLRRR